jgi:alpha-beta hydrolase superfamily lysophospholipase
MDFNIKLKNGQILKGIIQSPGEHARAVIIFVHGLGEHIQRYSYWIELFNKEGISFAGVDLPGHGRSDGMRGYIKNYALLVNMLDILIDTSRKTFPGVPLFIYGHSLGGGIALDYLLRNNPRVKGAIITSPWLRLSFQPAGIKILMASLMKYIFPCLLQPSGLNVSHLSHDVDVVEKYEADPLVHNKISVSLFYSAMNAANYSLTNAAELKVPTLLMHGSEDLITSPEGSREFAEKSEKAELKIWDGGFHELHNELFKDEVFKYIINWINTKIK